MKDQFKNSDVYDIEACRPITDILESYFLNIEFAYEFQNSTLNEKKGLLLDIALEIQSGNDFTQVNEIPQMKGVQEVLDKLTIRT